MARIRKSLLILTLLLGLVLAGGLVWREVVVETAARLVLSSRGLTRTASFSTTICTSGGSVALSSPSLPLTVTA